MNRAVCTISTKSHLPKVYALFESIVKFEPNISLKVLLSDVSANEINNISAPFPQVKFHSLEEFNSPLATSIIKKYKSQSDKLRWSFKPVFLSHLLSAGYDKVIYVDNDIFFTNPFNFLWDELDSNKVLLTPHWRPSNPANEPLWFETNFRDGIYNAGFIGVSKGAEDALNWWANTCLYKVTKSYIQGMFDDQKYLDMMPVVEPSTKVIAHQGCNVAYWNIKEAKRKNTSGEVKINGKYPVVFIHYADCTIAAILRGEDPELKPLLDDYLAVLKKHGFNISLDKILKKESFWVKYRNAKWQLLWSYLNWFK